MVSQVDNNTVNSTYETDQTKNTSNVSGQTIGDPKLSEKASKYYEQLKKKFSNMDFILVSRDQKEQAKAQAGSYANANHMVVLIDEDKLEKMASDKQYRDKYEGIIRQAGTQMPRLQSSLGSASSKVKTFGIQMNDDGTASFFAVLKKNGSARTKKLLQKSAEKKKAKKAEERKNAEKERMEELREKNSTSADFTHRDYDNRYDEDDDDETITVSASSMDGLIQKVKDMEYDDLSNHVQTKEEKQVGQHIDFRM